MILSCSGGVGIKISMFFALKKELYNFAL